MKKKLVLLIAGMLLTASTAMAATLAVPGSYSSIQEALNAAADGDEVVVGRGVYYENLSFPMKKITLKSTSGATQTVIDGGKKAPVMNLIAADMTIFPSVTVDGFTIQNGLGLDNDWTRGAAGGINVYGNWAITVNNSVLTNNVGTFSGGAISVRSKSFTDSAYVFVNNSTISNNTAEHGGAAWAYLGSAIVWFEKCNIINNHAVNGGAFYSAYSSTIRAYNSYVSGNSATKGGAGYSTGNGGSGIVLENAVVDNNSATEIGGAFYADGKTWLSGSHNTIVKNSAPVGGSFYLDNGLGQITNSIIYGNSSPMFIIETTYPGSFNHFSGCIVEGGVAGAPDLNVDPAGVLDADPNFVNYAARNYQLAVGSPAIDRISNGYPGTDILGLGRPQGSGADIGAYEVLNPDTQAPVSTAVITGVTGNNGFYTSDVMIDLTATDDVAFKEIHYIVNGVEAVNNGPVAYAFYVNGTHTISFYSVDVAGNVEALQTATIKIDKTAPAVTSSSPAKGATGVSRTASVVLTFGESILQGSAFSSITLKKGTATVSSTKTISGTKLTIKPSSSMSSASTYTVTVPAGALIDAAGNPNAAYSFTFKTN